MTSAAGLLIPDDQGRIILVDPVYKPYWDLVGGIVEAGESPREAAQREATEELGLTVEVGRLLVVDHMPAGGLRFVFAGRFPADADPDVDIRLPEGELREWRWCWEGEAAKLTADAPILWRRIQAAWDAHWSDHTIYLEDGYRVAGC